MKTNTIYSLNKKEIEAIIYKDAYGNIIRLEKDQFSSEEEFLFWKKWSDEDYHENEKEIHRYENHVMSLEVNNITANADESYDNNYDNLEREQLHHMIKIGLMKHLTETQRRRLILYAVKKLSEVNIAELEGVSQKCVSVSINRAKKIMRSYLKKE